MTTEYRSMYRHISTPDLPVEFSKHRDLDTATATVTGPLSQDHFVESWVEQRDIGDWHRVGQAPPSFNFQVDTEVGVTYTPWTDGWAIGYKVTAKDQPDRYVFLNPSNSETVGEANCFVYVETEDVSHPDMCPSATVCFVHVYDPSQYTKDDRVLTYCGYCEETVQTDGDQVPTKSETFDELLDNFGRAHEGTPHIGQAHTLYHQAVQ